MKNGVRTSEFWVTVLAGPLVALVKAVWPEAPDEALYSVVAGAIAYIASRTIVKSKNGG